MSNNKIAHKEYNENAYLASKNVNLYKSIMTSPKFTQYHRLFLLVIIANVIYMANLFNVDSSYKELVGNLYKISLYNFTLAILIRQQYVVNALFKLATCSKTMLPLPIRWHLAKIFHFGGIHTSAATMGSIWFLFGLTISIISTNFIENSILLIVNGIIMLLLSLMLIFALPSMRSKYHNAFEWTHRLFGWSVLALFWAQWSLVRSTPIVNDIQFWLLTIITLSIILPWLRLRRVAVTVTKPSNHAVILSFDYGVKPFPGSSTTISHSPLGEWHSFANIPHPYQSGYRLIVSRAGDWTGSLIESPPKHLWVKGIPTAGVANIELLFKKVVYVATGSGIGPVLPHLLAKKVPMTLLWATRNPEITYGNALVEEIKIACPSAVIWDTDQLGKPNLIKLSIELCRSFDAEAVICISNRKLTEEVIHGLEVQNIPAYGAIWDS